MAPTKKQTATNKKFDWKRLASALLIGTVIGTLGVLVYDKYRVREVICQIVGADEQSAVIAARCMIK